jgi:hypothetical protein
MSKNDSRYEAAWQAAVAAGEAAADAVEVVPMVVVERENPWDDSSPVVKRYAPVEGGVCGFAWVKVYPGNSRFANWLKRSGKGRSAYGGGVSYWVSRYGQSMTRKEAFAQAVAESLRSSLVEADARGGVYAGSRMD